VIARRALLALAVGAGTLAIRGAEACSLVVRRDLRFSDAACRRSLADWLRLLNEGRLLTEDQLTRRADALSVDVDQEALWSIIGDDATKVDRSYAFYRRYTSVAGKADRAPARLVEVNFLKGVHGQAIYQFTVRRDQFHPADEEGCNGLLTHGDFYGIEDRSYLGVFRNNRLATVRDFSEWTYKA